MNESLPTGETFGNYLVHGISEIRAPEPIGFFPEAPGWTAVWILLLLTLIWTVFRRFQKWRNNAYRRHALAAIDRLQQTSDCRQWNVLFALPKIIKYTALKAYPEAGIEPVSGERWIQFLENCYPKEGFNRDIAANLVIIAYQAPERWGIGEKEASQTIDFAKNWIRFHDRRIQDA